MSTAPPTARRRFSGTSPELRGFRPTGNTTDLFGRDADGDFTGRVTPSRLFDSDDEDEDDDAPFVIARPPNNVPSYERVSSPDDWSRRRNEELDNLMRRNQEEADRFSQEIDNLSSDDSTALFTDSDDTSGEIDNADLDRLINMNLADLKQGDASYREFLNDANRGEFLAGFLPLIDNAEMRAIAEEPETANQQKLAGEIAKAIAGTSSYTKADTLDSSGRPKPLSELMRMARVTSLWPVLSDLQKNQVMDTPGVLANDRHYTARNVLIGAPIRKKRPYVQNAQGKLIYV